MKERLITLLCAIGALALFAIMFLNRDGVSGGLDAPRPITSERRGNGYYAAMTWLESEHIRSVSLRDRYGTLATREDLAPTGNLLIVTLPIRTAFRTEEFVPLDRWVRAGNTLLVMASLSDNPDWHADFGAYEPGNVTLLTGLEIETTSARDGRIARRAHPEPENPATELVEGGSRREYREPLRTKIVANRDHAYFDGVKEIVALSDYPRRVWTVKVPYQGFVLSLAHEKDTPEGALWTRPLGKGRIIVSSYGTPFTNRAIGLADNAKLLANIVSANVSGKGTVLFDDGHQGISAAYDPNKFFSDRRLYTTIGVLVALWFIWVLGSTRLRLPVARYAVPREAELIRAAGSFLSRALPGHAAARQLIENFFHRVSSRAGFAQDGAHWELLQRNTRIDPDDLAQLRRWSDDAQAQRRVPLRSLYNLILRLDRQMAT